MWLKKHNKAFWTFLVGVAVTLSVVGFAATRAIRRPKSQPRSIFAPLAVPASNTDAYVSSARLPWDLRWHLKKLGDRIAKPGKERITMVGTIKRGGDAQALPMSLTIEFPDHLHLAFQDGVRQRVVNFNGSGAVGVGGPLTTTERELIESLVYDTEEHFLSSQTQGMATRFLGQRFRTDDGTTPNYNGPYYDLYEMTDQVKSDSEVRLQTKIYCFDSDNLFLQRVRYEIQRSGSPVTIETRLSNWQQTQGQEIPQRIVRWENGQPVMDLTVTSLAISARQDDGSFGQ